MAIPVNDNIQSNSPKSLENRSGRFISGVWRPYLTTQEFLDTVNEAFRYETQLIFVYKNGTDASEGVEVYWLVGGRGESNIQPFLGAPRSVRVEMSSATTPISKASLNTDYPYPDYKEGDIVYVPNALLQYTKLQNTVDSDWNESPFNYAV